MRLRNRILIGISILLGFGLVSLAVALSYDAPCRTPDALPHDTEQMTAVVYRCYGPPEVLTQEQIAKPVAADDEVLVKVHAAALNPLDWHYMRGAPYVMRLMGSGLGAPKDVRLGVDFAGTVEAVGKDVTRFKPGDEVFGGKSGALAEYVTVREDRSLVLKPANLTFEQAASVPVAAITALQALRDKGQVRRGQKVLINGAAGGVGTFSIQIAKSMGAQVTGVCSTRNVELVRSLGADRVIDYTQEDFTRGAESYDVIIDNVGNKSLPALRHVLKPEGTLVIVGAGKGNWIGPFAGFMHAAVLQPFVDQKLTGFIAELNPQDLGLLSDLMRQGKVTPVVDRSYALREIREAMAYLEAGHARGKVVVTID